MSNKHSELFKAMAEADGPGDFEVRHVHTWFSLNSWSELLDYATDDGHEWRLKPRTVTHVIHGKTFTLPEPMTKEPVEEGNFYFSDTNAEVRCAEWFDNKFQTSMLAAGRCHATEADAQAWSDFERFARTGVE